MKLEFCVQRLEDDGWHFNNGTFDTYELASRICRICEKHERERKWPRRFRVALRHVEDWCEAWSDRV